MNTQWMTTLLSKGLELEQGLRKNLEQVQSQLRTELESRGVRLSTVDLAALVEEMAPGFSKAALNSVLDYLKPFTAGLGFRVARLSDTQIELVVPSRTRSRTDTGEMHEAVFVAGAIEAARLLWNRHAPLGDFQVQVRSLQLDIHRPTRQDVRVRFELPETQRETCLAQLRQLREARSEASLRIIDEGEQEIAQVEMVLNLRHQPALESPEG